MNGGVREEYFRNLNPLAQRIAEDIDKVKESYKDKWECLTYKEKNQIMDEVLVAADLNNLSQGKKEIQLEPLSKFSWFSKSQLDLFQYIDVKPKSPEIRSPIKTTEVKTEPSQHKNKSKFAKSPSSEDKLPEAKAKSHVAKPKMPPPPPPKKISKPNTKTNVVDEDDIPKTGFDFLDNW